MTTQSLAIPAATLAAARAALRAGRGEASAHIGEQLRPTRAVVDATPTWADAGREAFARGEAAVCVIAGGMASRFGGGAKAVVPVRGGASFLAIKRADARAAGPSVPFAVMTSFATSRAITEHVASTGMTGVITFEQGMGHRLTDDGDDARDAAGQPMPYATGHGDFFWCLHASGAFAALTAAGVRTLLFANVDNLGATLDEALLGQHLAGGCDMTAEVVDRGATGMVGSRGAAVVAEVGGRARLVEGLRLPPSLAVDDFPDVSINTFWLRLAALARPIHLPPLLVPKAVDGRRLWQLERISCEVTGERAADGRPMLSLQCVRVPPARFVPVKTMDDLRAMQGAGAP